MTRQERLTVIFIVLFLAMINTMTYVNNYAVICVDCDLGSPRMDAILNASIYPPFSYRVFTPMIQHILGGGLVSVILFHFVGNLLLLALTYHWTQRWQGNGLIAILILSAMMHLFYATWEDSDYALTEGILLLSGWLILLPGRNDAE